MTVLETRLHLSKVEEEKQTAPISELGGLTIKDIRKILFGIRDQDAPLYDIKVDDERVKYWLIEQFEK